jgi:hypothetical protein
MRIALALGDSLLALFLDLRCRFCMNLSSTTSMSMAFASLIEREKPEARRAGHRARTGLHNCR